MLGNMVMGLVGMFMLQKMRAKKCKECGVKDSYRIAHVNTDGMEDFAKETVIVMKCKSCGHEEYEPLVHCSSYAQDTLQMYALRYIKDIETFAKNISNRI